MPTGRVTVSEERDTALSLSLSTRVHLSLHHLLGAARMRAMAAKVEAENAGAAYGPFHDSILQFSMSSVMSSAGALEAYANQLIADINERAGAQVISRAIFTSPSILKKYDAMARHFNVTLNATELWYNSAEALVQLRNKITHFQPEWSNRRDIHDAVSQVLNSRFKPAAYLTHEPLFPLAWASSDCCRWAVMTVLEFIEEFTRATGQDNPLKKFRPRVDAALVGT
jgi:hypothetical protein